MKIEISCADCGSNRFDYPVRFADTSMIMCADCGHAVGTVAEVQRRVIEQMTGAAPEAAHRGSVPAEGDLLENRQG